MKKDKLGIIAFSILTLTLSSCVSTLNYTTSSTINNLKASNQKGVSISFDLSINNFSTKASENGIPATYDAIDHFLVYLIKNPDTSSYPLNGDPVSDIISGPFFVSAKGASSRRFILDNVLSSSSEAYYIAVRVQDNNNQDLVKENNGSVTPWTGSAASSPSIAVSSGVGIVVDNKLKVSNTTPLQISVNLKDQKGAKLETVINPDAGSLNSSSVSGNSIISTVAGNGTSGDSGENGFAINAEVSFLGSGSGITTDSKGNVYFSTDGKVKKVSPNGIISTFGGNGTTTCSFPCGDGGNAKLAEIDPTGLAFDSKGNLYVSDFASVGIRKISTDGTISSLSTVVSEPQGLFVSGNYLYIADKFDQVIYKVDLTTDILETVAGGGSSTSENISATDAKLEEPKSLVLDSLGNIYFTDSIDNKIRKVDTSGNISTIAGGGASTAENIKATNSLLDTPEGLAIDSSGNLYVSDSINKKIRKVDTSGYISTIAGNGSSTSFVEDNFALDEALGRPSSIAIDKTGNLYFQDFDNNRIRKVIF